MASLFKKPNSGNYFLIWFDPKRKYRRRLWESLKTKDPGKAHELKKRLESEYNQGIHKPWDQFWYQRSETKECRMCGVIQTKKNFYRNSRKNDGLSSYCKSCTIKKAKS